MAVAITRNFGDLRALQLVDASLMRDVGLLAVRLIRTRTERGVDVDGRGFVALSDGYAKQKQAALGHGNADLVVSGRMLNDMQVTDTSEKAVTIGFTSSGGGSSGGTFIQRSRSMGASDKAFFHNEVGSGKSRVIREFFGLSRDDTAQIVGAVERFIARQLAEVR